ncbi:MAG: nucleotidyltransferase domain-containing protein [Methanobrevibacter sp.]|jgi:predicted nucleotidyltransferase|nr:nucleotidyltransferase domain-containing protein [Candidatus Methanoflexus mossambicus]
MNRKQLAINFANSLKQKEIEKVILYGSVARGEDEKDSDIDVLILTTNDKDELKIKDDVYTKTFDTLLETGKYLSAKIFSIKHYNKYKHFSFFSNVDKDGIIIK